MANTQEIIQEITEGKHDDEIGELALVTQRRFKRISVLRRNEKGSPMVREFASIVRDHPGCTAKELAALMGITTARIYQLGYAATPRFIKTLDPDEYPRRFWPQKDSGTRP